MYSNIITMNEIKYFWIDGMPTVEHIKEAYRIVKEENYIVTLKWFVKYSGHYAISVDHEDIETMTPEEFFEKEVPHIYGV